MIKLMLAGLIAAAVAAPPQTARGNASGTRVCSALARHVDEAGGADRDAPVFLRSYEPSPDETHLPPALASSAFSYDNALAIMALSSCGDVARARRIGDAFVAAVEHDRTYRDGRVRNAYRAGPVRPGPVPLPGWWDAKDKIWAEDAYQDGTQTGNVAWVALALLTLDRKVDAGASAKTSYRTTAETLALWIVSHATTPPSGFGGFAGGVSGFDGQQKPLPWRSTEHNVDVHALGVWLSSLGVSYADDLAASSLRFLDAMFDAENGLFRLGTLPDGAVQPPDKVALDALTWPLIGVRDAPSAWRRSLAFAQSHLATRAGFDFNGTRGGIWTEGTAQASLVTRAAGEPARSSALLATALRQRAPSGYLYATDGGTITTGLRVGPDSQQDDFFYFHRPHLGATAWAELAASGTNPFTGAKVD